MRVGVVIPARQWSAGLPGKNRATMAATLAVAEALSPAWIVVTTDDPVFWDLPVTVVHRPIELEDGPTGPVVAHAIQGQIADVVVLLQPSSPTANRLRYVQAALAVLEAEPETTSVVSVVPWLGEPPQKAVYRALDGTLGNCQSVRRQDCAPAYRRDGTVYATRWMCAADGDLYGPVVRPMLVTPEESVTLD